MARAAPSKAKGETEAQDREDIWTYQEYLELPDDGKRYEILNGRLEMTPSPSTRHQAVSRNLGMILWDFVRKNNLGEVFYAPLDVVFDQVNVVQPDILFVSRERQELIKKEGIFGAPDLVVEIQSPGTLHVDAKRKKGMYERFGVREYWIIDPGEKKVEVYLLKGGRYVQGGIYTEKDSVECASITGLSVPLADVFAV